jgi:uncharacterized protein YebE (UPF0316 family)
MISPEIFTYAVVPLLIFLVRVVDVSMGTIRIIFVSRGIRYFAAILGFFEVLIWLFAISQIMRNLNSPMHYIAYAAGFSMGNFVGITIERRLSLGNRVVRIITRKDSSLLISALKKIGYGITIIDGEGATGPVKLIFSVVRRDHVPELIQTIKNFNPNAFYTIEDVMSVWEENLMPPKSRTARLGEFIQKKR